MPTTDVRRKILLAEDDSTNRQMLTVYLQKKGFSVIGVANGLEVLDALGPASSPRPVDLLLLDWMMPLMSGIDALRRLRADGHLVPVIMLTALGDPRDMVDALELGADDYVTKPYELAVLCARIEARLRRSALPAQTSQPTTSSRDERPALGVVIDDRYELLEQIGSGSFGVVYRARHTTLETEVAVKILQATTTSGTRVEGRLALDAEAQADAQRHEAREFFRREGVRACRVQHDHAVRVFDFGIMPNGLPFLVMELLRGRTLEQELHAHGRLGLRRAVEVLLPVCACLAAAHENKLVHRDVKPANIFLHQMNGQEVVKVLDFGVAKLLDAGQEASLEGIVGSPAYMAPERLRGRPYDGRSDVYAVGVVLYQLLTGVVPFRSENNDSMAVMLMQIRDTAVPPSWIHPGLPDVVDTAVARFIDKEPERRPTAHEAVERLQDLLDAASL